MRFQRGGTFLGFVIGVVVGLGAALAVAVYVTKVPVPFMNKGQTRSADQDAAETQKNKDWDPNAPLYGKNPAKPVPATVPGAAASAPAGKASGKADEKPDGKPDAKADGKEAKAAASADPIGELAKSKAASDEPFAYWIQVGAFRTPEDAESHRAKLSLSGIESKVSEREQSGRMVYRVRVGPFEKKEDAEQSKEKLEKSGMDTALVRVQR
jgi:cell division protein FtsN